MAKRGRPRVYTQSPTPEVAARRRALARGGDPAMTTTPLDLLANRNMIDGGEADAGRIFGWMRRQLYGAVEVAAFELGRIPGVDMQGDDRAGLQYRYGVLREVLRARGRRVADVTENVSVYQRWPGVLTKANPAGRDRRELELLREGLQTLSRELFRAGEKAA